MAIQFNYTDPQTNVVYPNCYGRLEGATFDANSQQVSVRVAMYRDEATRRSTDPKYRPFDAIHVVVLDVIDPLDTAGDKRLWRRTFVDDLLNSFTGNPIERLYKAVKAANSSLGAGQDV